ncbi:chorion peroxidase-like [Mya arenaria]|uniref:chorion peroxidase-like n=1 Tax=Mya arenaria TaxID=6604 RepID=UPI0022DEBCA1|nr:chorion peroxidase-like [Mya arenaria]
MDDLKGFLSCVVLVTVAMVTTVSGSHSQPRAVDCDALIRQANDYYYTGAGKPRYTCHDRLYLIHGQTMHYKCQAIKKYLQQQNAESCMRHCSGLVEINFAPVFPNIFKNIGTDCGGVVAAPCDPRAPYRQFDGSCNNLANPSWGMSEHEQNRVVPNDYDDSTGSPRTVSSCDGSPLPSARTVSINLHSTRGSMQTERKYTYMMMLFSQFLSHDMILTKMFKRTDGEQLLCCGEDANDTNCFPVQIPLNDPRFTPGGCMSFPRSIAALGCNNVRQQRNSQTSYIDLSLIYAPNKATADTLRQNVGGLITNVNGNLPPNYEDTSCELKLPFNETSYYCSKSGDPRVDEQPGLSALHTVFLRAHNAIASGLARVNPHWNDELLYQESRKILIAIWQNIVWGEFLPLLLGRQAMRAYNIHLSKHRVFKDTYDPNVDATVINGVGSSAFRLLENSVQERLFLDERGESFDLATLNIQRGRDHGNPGYNTYRRYCGLSEAFHFGSGSGGLVDFDPKTAAILAQTYKCPDDIDLFTAVIAERRVRGGLLGPLGTCLVAVQYKRYRDGDRFFFERGDPLTGFNHDQLKAIRNIKLSHIFRLHLDTRRIQRNVFVVPSRRQPPHRTSLMEPSFRHPWSFPVALIATSLMPLLIAGTSVSTDCEDLFRDETSGTRANDGHVKSDVQMLMSHGGRNIAECPNMRKRSSLSCNTRCTEDTPSYKNKYSATQSGICKQPEVNCCSKSPFRSLDGACNNLAHSRWGQAERVQNRIVDNAFEDGVGAPRATSSCSGASLPSPRAVSVHLHTADATMETERNNTYMLTVLGQFLAHDFVLTNVFERPNGNFLDCCEEDISK